MAQLQLSFDGGLAIHEEPSFIRDIDCREQTPVIHGLSPEPIYGKSICTYPTFHGRTATKYDQDVFLTHLDPLESYDQCLVFFSGGKDSVASVLNLIELGMPKEKIVLLHHDVSGGGEIDVDWPVTKPYCLSFAKAHEIPAAALAGRKVS